MVYHFTAPAPQQYAQTSDSIRTETAVKLKPYVRYVRYTLILSDPFPIIIQKIILACSTTDSANRGCAQCRWVGVFLINLLFCCLGAHWIFISTSQLLCYMWSGLQGLPQGSIHQDFQAIEGGCFLPWTAELIACYRLRAAHHDCTPCDFPGQISLLLAFIFFLNWLFSGRNLCRQFRWPFFSFSLPCILMPDRVPLWDTRRAIHKHFVLSKWAVLFLNLMIQRAYKDLQWLRSNPKRRLGKGIVSLQWHSWSLDHPSKIPGGTQGWDFMGFCTNSVCLEIIFSCFNWLTYLFFVYAIFLKFSRVITIYSCTREVY